jgi:NADH-quinone oxidoreductase subunit G
LRQAALEGASISYVNPLTLDLNYEAQQLVDAPSVMVKRLESIAKALGIGGNLVSGAVDDEACKAVAEQLRAGERKAVLLGAMAMAHPDFAIIEQLADKIAAATSANFGYLLEGANSVGAQLAGASPLHSPGGKAVEVAGRNSEEIQSSPVKGALLLAVDPLLDSVNPIKANASLAGTGRVVALTAFRTQGLEQCADIMLPIGWFAETSGTYVNLQGDWQSVAGAIPPAGEARPAWKVLRVLGNMTDTEGFDYTSSDEIRNELKDLCADVDLNNTVGDTDAKPLFKEGSLTRIGAVNLYHSDYAVRNSAVLQQTKDAQFANYCRMNIATASAFDLTEGDRVMVQQGGVELNLPVAVDAGIPDDCIAVAAGIQGSGALGPVYGEITLEKE